MKHATRLRIITGFCLLLLTSTSWSQDKPTQPLRVEWGVSVGVNRYEEPNLMQLQGPEVGLHPRITGWNPMPKVQFEGDFLIGTQRYTSTRSGSKDGVTNLETRWRALAPVFGNHSVQDGFSSGLAVHTLWNDLRGRTSTDYGGYERSALQLWLPVRWASGDAWELDMGLLLYGRHTSKLSEVGAGYSDAINRQRKGRYAQLTMKIHMQNGDAIKPFVRYTHLDDSDMVLIRSPITVNCPTGWCNATEPKNHRWQIGAIWEFNAL